MANKQYSKTIRINSDFDPSSILKGIKAIRDQLGSVSKGKGRNLLGNIDNDIIKLEKATESIARQIAKGFSSNKDIQQFNKQMDSVLDSVLEVKKELGNSANFSLDALKKESSKAFDEISKQLTDLQKKIRTTLTSKAKPVFGATDRIMGIIAGDNISDKMFDKRKQELQDELKLQKQNTQALREYLTTTAKLKSLQNTISKKDFVDSEYKKTKTNLFTFFTPDRSYSQSTYGRDIRETKISKSGATIYTQKFNDTALDLINILYKQLLEEAAKSGIQLEQFKKQFITELKTKYAVSITDPKDEVFSGKLKDDLDKAQKAFNNPTVKDSKQLTDSVNRERKLTEQIITIEELSATAKQGAQSLEPLIAKQSQLGDVASQNETILKQLINDINGLNQPLQTEMQAWSKVSEEINKTAQSQEKIDNGFDAIIRRASMLFSVGTIFNFIRRQISETYQDVRNLDKSFAQIAMVTNYHVEELWSNYNQYAEMANKLGQTTNDVIQASVLFYQQGLETNEVLSLTEDTMKLATLAGVDFADATDLMTAALRGFKLEMSEGSHVTDVYSELAAHAAASVNEIANAMNKTAAIANSAGMSFENTAAFLTQMIESTQESAANIGTALKTVNLTSCL